ncbi:ABC transporter ATP-binding protein [Portibacter lacus]|uniref:Bacitracin ABC transporter ATP-binding protein n=1 Tax=Portibacter lacus TaxID=1099794 RepID=A0AA37WGM6_9BACT|nr:ATP-binding cassette domain-containing protein [Portibacter lacus]GLR20187.1 bacitracin ABC transporter ATP-binding protein [Portibacter lacus]
MNESIIETKKLNFSYTKGKMDVEDMELKVPKGSIYGFLGPNGSGKSTTIRLILGLLKKDSGSVSLFGEIYGTKNKLDILSRVGALIENPSLYEHLTATENLRIAANYRQNISSARINEVLEIVNLFYAKEKKVKAFSLGMKQRLGLAISLLSSPELIILDEPTNGLDPKGIIEMRALIKDLNEKHGTTIFISSHLLTEIERTCTHVGIIRNGKMIYQDTVTSLKQSKVGKIKVNIEVDHASEALTVLKLFTDGNAILIDDQIQIEVNKKEEITGVIDALRANGISIYHVSVNNNLEEHFLSLTEN